MNTHGANPLKEFLAGLKELTTDEERRASLSQYASLDDGWCFQGLRSLQKTPQADLLSACLDVVLDRAPRLRSIWKRKGDLSDTQFVTLRERIKEITSAEAGTLRLQEVRRRLLGRGVLFTLFQFTPFAEDRSTKESVMLIRWRNGNLVPASRMSPLIRGLKDLWAEDIHLYAFAEVSNSITIDEILELMRIGTAPTT